jgi:alcohol dehydrogenase class IV
MIGMKPGFPELKAGFDNAVSTTTPSSAFGTFSPERGRRDRYQNVVLPIAPSHRAERFFLDYTFFSPAQVVFGWGRRTELPRLAMAWGRRVFFISGSRTLERAGIIDSLAHSLTSAGLTVIRFTAPAHEPEVADVDALTQELLTHQPTAADVIIAVGGGSTIDLTKAVAAMATNLKPGFSSGKPRFIPRSPHSPSADVRHSESAVYEGGESPAYQSLSRALSVINFLEGVGKGLKIERPPLPMIAVPTTAGTGTEATKNAVISSYDPPFKKSLRSDLMVPRCVLIDPELTVSLPPTITAYTGMDAITQLIESYVSRRAAPIPRALCEHGLELALLAIRQAVSDGGDRSAREAMSHAAFLSGLALANSGLGLAHGIAAALGVHCRVPHGLACAVMLPQALRANRSVSEADLARLSRHVLPNPGLSDSAAAETLINEIESMCRDVKIPNRLRELGVEREQIPQLVIGSHGNSLSGNPREISDAELRDILEAMW